MNKKVKVVTSSGTYLYKVSESNGTYNCMRYVNTFLGNWENIGKSRNMEDALAIIKSHARKYGSVYSVDID